MRRGLLIGGAVIALAGFIPWSMWTPGGYAFAGVPILANVAPLVLAPDQVSKASKLAMLAQANRQCSALGIDADLLSGDSQRFAPESPSLKHALLTSNTQHELLLSQSSNMSDYCQSVASRLGSAELAQYQRRQ